MPPESAEARPGSAKGDPILVADRVQKNFDGLLAVDVEHLEVQKGWITALIGPNGAGKTTLFNVLTGFEAPTRGTWTFGGEALAGKQAHQIAARGLVRTFQLTKVLAGMPVLDNMRLGAKNQIGERFLPGLLQSWRSQEVEVTERAETLLEEFSLTSMRDEYAGTLSGGQRKLLEMARALMAEPGMLLLDEPVAGVNPVLAESILEHLQRLRREGMTILFVEHSMDVVMGVSDWVVCMAEGRVIAEGTPGEVGRNQAVIDAYLGTDDGNG